MSFISELKRRRLVQVGITYLIVAWGIAQVADLLLDNFQMEEWIMQAVLIALGIGCVLAIILAWIFDLRWDGLHFESDVARDLAKNAELLAAPAQQVEDESIAVLPFVNMSSDPEQEYFSDGISEELLNLLAKIPELRVAARTSAFSYKGKDTKIDVIGRELGVAHVLEGSVRKAGSKVRITAQLIRAETGYHLWSETWDRTLEDIFDVQDEIAAVVVEELKLTLLKPAPVAQETNPETYALYLRARHLTRQGTPESYERALELLEKALAIASDYAPAWRQRGVIYMTQADRGLRPDDEGFELGREATEMALSIDPGNALAHASLCRIAMSEDQDLSAAAGHMQTALSLNPTDPTILSGAATMAETLGRLDTAIALQEFIARRDPVQPTVHSNLGGSYIAAGQPEKAITSYRSALRLSPGSIGLHANLGLALLANGEIDSALEEIARESFEPCRLIAESMAYYDQGRTAESDAALAEMTDKYGTEWAYNIAAVLAYRGEADRAFEWLETAVEHNDSGLIEIVTQPEFAKLHDDPRWIAFLTRIGKSPEQLAAIQFQVSLPS
jgi:TolB-like protein/predicted Zn-dependent protease